MKKLILILSLMIFATLTVINFASYKTVETKQLPVSSIIDGKFGFVFSTMKINNDKYTVKVKMENEFFMIKDQKWGMPEGSYTLSKKVNVFGFTKYEAHNAIDQGV